MLPLSTLLHFIITLLPLKLRLLILDRAAVLRKRRQEAIHWRHRIAEVISCPDNALLHRHPCAGKVHRGMQTMHNGIRVKADGYYGPWMTRLLLKNRGSHEPQEEVVFAEVIQRTLPGSRMLECGAYWGFYSLWFTTAVQDSKAWLIEPNIDNLALAKYNFKENGRSASFIQASIARMRSSGIPPKTSIDAFLTEHSISRLEILHADIQGSEVDMLHGSHHALRNRLIDYIFISTHGEDIHHECRALLRDAGYELPVSILPEQSYSHDGLLVCTAPGILKRPLPHPHLREKRGSKPH